MLAATGARRDLVVITATIGLAAILFPGALLRGELFFERDLQLEWYPRLAALGRCLRQGDWPLWDPSVGFGQPLLADPAAEAAYPLSWPTLFVPANLAYTLFALTHLCLAAVGTRRLAARLGAGWIGASAAAAAFVLSGPLQSSLNLWHHFAGACWMPWVVLAGDRAAQAPRPRRIACLAFAAGLQLLAGSADLCVMTWVLTLGVAAFEALRPRVAAPRVAGALLVGAGLAGGIGSVVWLPAAELVSRSARHELPIDVRGAWSVPVEGLLRLVSPLDPERVPFDADRWRRLYDRPAHPLLFSLYLGLATIGLAAAAPVDARRRWRATFLLACAAAAVALATGPHGGVYSLVAALALPMRALRYPSKAMLVAALALALAAGLGVGALARARLGPRTLRVAAACILLAAAVSWAASEHYAGAGTLAAPLACLASAILLLGAAGRVGARLAALAIALLMSGELTLVHSRLNPTAPASLVFEPPAVLRRLDLRESPRLYVYDYHTFPETAERLVGRGDPYRTPAAPPGMDGRVLAALALRDYLPPRLGGLFGLLGSYEYDTLGLYPRDLNDLAFFLRHVEGTPVHLKLLRMGAVGMVLSLHRAGLEGLHLEQALPSLFPEPILVWRVPGAQPRSWVVGRTRVADAGQAFQALVDPAFDPSREAIVAEGEALAGQGDFAAEARLTTPGPDRVRVDAEASGRGLLVLADAYDPGWRASVDGRPAPVLRANIAFRGVALPAGRHTVEMVYRPSSAKRGLAVSCASLLVTAVIAAARGRGGRPRRRR
jgi:hypothetical protein